MIKLEIKVENTAITNGVSKSVKENMEMIKSPILDYGAGKLRNARYLVEQGYCVSVLDIPAQISKWSEEDKGRFTEVYLSGQKIERTYKTILLTFVLNVIPSLEDRKSVLKEIDSLLDNEGTFIVEVRREKGILNSKNIENYEDGYVVGKGKVRTFQKPYTKEEFVNFISEVFEVKNVKMESDSIIIVAGRKEK